MIGIFDIRTNNQVSFGNGISKVSKVASEIQEAAASSVPVKSDIPKLSAKYQRNTIFNIDRGILRDADMRLVEKIKESVDLVQKRLSKIKNKVEKNKVSTYPNIVTDPFTSKILEFKVNSSTLTSISGRKVKLQGDNEVYLELNAKGYFSGGNKYLINSEGEIIKRPAPAFSRDAGIHKYDEPVYYSQKEINNLGLNKELTLFNTELEKFNHHINNLEKPEHAAEELLKAAKLNQEQDYTTMISSFEKKFNLLKNGIENVGAKNVRRKKVIEQECKFRISKGAPIMQLNDVNNAGNTVLLSMHSLNGKKAVKIVVLDDKDVKNIFLIKDNFIVKSKDVPRAMKTPYYKQIDTYTTEELKREGILKLLDDIERRIDSGYDTMKGMFGETRLRKKS